MDYKNNKTKYIIEFRNLTLKEKLNIKYLLSKLLKYFLKRGNHKC